MSACVTTGCWRRGTLSPRGIMRAYLCSRVAESLGTADLHLHTRASDGLMATTDLVDYAEHFTHLDVIAVTDHDETTAALEAREYAARKRYRVQIVPGGEVSTRDGHLLALFV